MHMADALIVPTVAGTMYAASAAAAVYSVKKVRQEDDAKKIPVMGVMGAFVFAAQMINFTIPGTGSSGHLCGGMLISAILGPYAGFLAMIGVLFIQCILFADGGLLAFGCNVWNMAFYGCFAGALLIWKNIMKNGVTRKKIIAASVIGCVATMQLGAFSVTLETLASGVSALPFTAFVSVMQPIHLAIGLAEGCITAAVLVFVYQARPSLLWGIGTADEDQAKGSKGRLSYRSMLAVIAAAAAVTAGGLSVAASSFPDGLEWSMEKVAGSSELEADGGVYEAAQQIQDMTAVLPDYSFKDTDTVLGTSFSGIAGGIAVMGLCIGCSCLFRFFKRRNVKNSH